MNTFALFLIVDRLIVFATLVLLYYGVGWLAYELFPPRDELAQENAGLFFMVLLLMAVISLFFLFVIFGGI